MGILYIIHVALFEAILNWQIFVNPANRVNFPWPTKYTVDFFFTHAFIHIFC